MIEKYTLVKAGNFSLIHLFQLRLGQEAVYAMESASYTIEIQMNFVIQFTDHLKALTSTCYKKKVETNESNPNMEYCQPAQHFKFHGVIQVLEHCKYIGLLSLQVIVLFQRLSQNMPLFPSKQSIYISKH